MTRPGTVPPRGVAGWLHELAAIAMTVALIGALSYAWHVFHVRRSTVHVEVSDCLGNVVFAADDQRWKFDAGGDCERFRVGDRWIIAWNRYGLVKPERRR